MDASQPIFLCKKCYHAHSAENIKCFRCGCNDFEKVTTYAEDINNDKNMTKQQWEREKVVELYMKALGNTNLPEKVWKAIAKVNQQVLDQETGKISDGYHTFDELYEHRITLFIALCQKIQNFVYFGDTRNNLGNDMRVWRSKLHEDGTMFEGWFILGINRAKGNQITYHLPIEKWEETKFAQTLKKAPKFDGHTSKDVIKRLKNLSLIT